MALCLLGAVVFMINAWSNITVVEIETIYGNGISIGWFLVITLLLAVLTAHMVYKPYILDTNNGRSVVMQALIMYIAAQIFWSLALFHSRVNRGTAGLAAVLLLAATVWLGWVCYHFVKDTIFIFLLLLIWCLYLQDYTYNVDAHPWTPIPFE